MHFPGQKQATRVPYQVPGGLGEGLSFTDGEEKRHRAPSHLAMLCANSMQFRLLVTGSSVGVVHLLVKVINLRLTLVEVVVL